jgi:hypothetical protein
MRTVTASSTSQNQQHEQQQTKNNTTTTNEEEAIDPQSFDFPSERHKKSKKDSFVTSAIAKGGKNHSTEKHNNFINQSSDQFIDPSPC